MKGVELTADLLLLLTINRYVCRGVEHTRTDGAGGPTSDKQLINSTVGVTTCHRPGAVKPLVQYLSGCHHRLGVAYAMPLLYVIDRNKMQLALVVFTG